MPHWWLQVASLEGGLVSAEAGRTLAEKAAQAASRHLQEATAQVAKAQEREAVLGLKHIVPGKLVDRGVQVRP